MGINEGMDALLEDSRLLVHHVSILAAQHRPDTLAADALCSCGTPYSACPVAQRIRNLESDAIRPVGPSHWFG